MIRIALMGLVSFFILGIYAVILDARLAEQKARIQFNALLRGWGLEGLYSLEELKGDRID